MPKYSLALFLLLLFNLEGKAQTNLQDSSRSEIFTVVDQMPEFPGGQEGLMQFLSKNVNYPSSAIKKNIQGKVFVSFLVGVDGSISDIVILKGASIDLDEEALRVIRLMPKWKPGVHQGRAVIVRYQVPIIFKLT